MEVLEEQRDRVIILLLVGRLDANTSKDLVGKLLALIESDSQRFIIDCATLD